MADGTPAKPRPGGWRAQRVQDRMDRLADHIADGGSFPAFSQAEGIHNARSHQLWQMICTDLGEQAA